MKQTVTIHLSNGAGNNLFQYFYARLLAEAHGADLHVETPSYRYYGVAFLKSLGLPVTRPPLTSLLPSIRPRDNNALTITDNDDLVAALTTHIDNPNVELHGAFEDYRLYAGHLDRIRAWIHTVEKTNVDDLVLHLRLGDRLYYDVQYEPGMFITFDQYKAAIARFEYKKLWVVTDLHEWKEFSVDDVKRMKFHTGNKLRSDSAVERAHAYLADLREGFNALNANVLCGRTLQEDFDFIRSFDKILFVHGTFAWWAAALSSATRVGVYGPWRPSKGDKNKNLGQTDYTGWFSWQ